MNAAAAFCGRKYSGRVAPRLVTNRKDELFCSCNHAESQNDSATLPLSWNEFFDTEPFDFFVERCAIDT
jgi:hypothetical protein